MKWEECHGIPDFRWDITEDLRELERNWHGNNYYDTKSVQVNGKVYIAFLCEKQSMIYEYVPEADSWTVLPPAPLHLFGLGRLNGRLVIVGGRRVGEDEETLTGEIYSYDRSSQQWIKPASVPPLPAPRCNPMVISTNEYLLVMLGSLASRKICYSVDVFFLKTLKWYKGSLPPTFHYENLPMFSVDFSSVEINDRIIVALETDIFELRVLFLEQMPSASCSTTENSCVTEWDTFQRPSSGYYIMGRCNSSLLAVEGSKVFFYSPVTKGWHWVGQLPCASANWRYTIDHLSNGELLVTAGPDISKYFIAYKCVVHV